MPVFNDQAATLAAGESLEPVHKKAQQALARAARPCLRWLRNEAQQGRKQRERLALAGVNGQGGRQLLQ